MSGPRGARGADAPRVVVRAQQVLLMLVALAIAGAMIVLGLWQMQVFANQGASNVEARAAAPAVPLADVAVAGQENLDGYGRSVTFAGRYLPEQQYLIAVPGRPGHFRVLTALERADGSVVPVVRGESEDASPPAPPAGVVRQEGLFLASEAVSDAPVPSGQLGSVRLSQLAQSWKQPMVPGFVTLSAPLAQQQGLAQAQVSLPQGEGHVRNGGYALQWWIFAGFGLVIAVKLVRDLGRVRDWEDADSLAAAAEQEGIVEDRER